MEISAKAWKDLARKYYGRLAACKDELDVTDKLFEERHELLKMIPGQNPRHYPCIPCAKNWVRGVDNAIRKIFDICENTPHADDFHDAERLDAALTEIHSLCEEWIERE